MTENTNANPVKIESLDGKGALWTIAGTTIAMVAQKFLNGGGINLCGNGPQNATQNVAQNAAMGACLVELANKDSEIALLKADKYTDQKLVEVYKDLRAQDKAQEAMIGSLATRLAAMETAAPLREQIVLGKIGEVATLATTGLANLGSQVTCLANTVAGITKTVVPITAVCPQPMPQYNSWTAPTTATT